MELSELMTIAASCSAAIGGACIILALCASLRDRKIMRNAARKNLIIEAEAQAFIANARIAEKARNIAVSHRKEDEDRRAAKVILGLDTTREHDKEAVMSAWRKMMKENHPDITKKTTAIIVIEKINIAREMLLKNYT